VGGFADPKRQAEYNGLSHFEKRFKGVGIASYDTGDCKRDSNCVCRFASAMNGNRMAKNLALPPMLCHRHNAVKAAVKTYAFIEKSKPKIHQQAGRIIHRTFEIYNHASHATCSGVLRKR
jgi:hypothetical protein